MDRVRGYISVKAVGLLGQVLLSIFNLLVSESISVKLDCDNWEAKLGTYAHVMVGIISLLIRQTIGIMLLCKR